MMSDKQPRLSEEISFDDIDLGFPVADPGVYEATVRFKGVRGSKAGNSMAEFGLSPVNPVPCEINDPTNKGVVRREVSNREIWTYFCVIKPGALFNLKEMFVAVGERFDAKSVSELIQEVNEKCPSFNGKVVRAQVEKVTNEDRVVNRVRHVWPA